MSFLAEYNIKMSIALTEKGKQKIMRNFYNITTERYNKLKAENDSLKIKLGNAQERYVELLKEYEEYKKRIKKARIKHEKSFDKVYRQWSNNYWELDQVIMNR